jgi:hypothetical protein
MDPNIVKARIQSIVAEEGLTPAAKRLQLSPATLARMLAGTHVNAGTIALCALRLGLLVPAPLALSTMPLPRDVG